MTSQKLLPKLTAGLRALLIFLMTQGIVAHAQGPVVTVGAPNPKTFSGAPTGSCGPQDTAVDTTTGNFYTCQGGSWHLAGGGGGGSGTVSGQSNGVIPLATGATTIGAQSHLSDNGTAIAATLPLTNTKNVQIGGGDPWIDVTAPPYNAKGDGSTDDTAAIQSALNACGTAGGRIAIPAGPGGGVYALKGAALTLGGTNCQIVADPKATIQAQSGFSGGTILSINGGGRMLVSGGTWDCNSIAAQGMAPNPTPSATILMEKFEIKGCTNGGIYGGLNKANGQEIITIRDVYIHDQTGVSVFIFTDAHLTIEHSKFLNTSTGGAAAGVGCSYCSSYDVHDNTFNNVGNAEGTIYALGIDSGNWTYNHFYNTPLGGGTHCDTCNNILMDHNESIGSSGTDWYCEGSSFCTISNNITDNGFHGGGAVPIITGAAVAGIAAGRHQLNALSSTTGLVAASHVTLGTVSNFPTSGITGVSATMDASFTTGTVFYQNLSRNCGQVGPWWWLWIAANWQGGAGTFALVISNSTNLATQDVVMPMESIGGTPVRLFNYGYGWGAGLGCGTSGMQSWGIVCLLSCTSHSVNVQDFELSGETFHNVITGNRARGGTNGICIELRNQEGGLVEGNTFYQCNAIQVNDSWPPVVIRNNITYSQIYNAANAEIIGVDSTNNGAGLSAAIDGGGNVGYTANSPIGATGFLPMAVTYNLTNGGIIMGSSSATPSISSGFGTSPSVPCATTTTAEPCIAAAFTVNVGTGGTASSGVIAMNATAPTGWACKASDLTTTSATVFQTKQTATTQTTATIGNFNTSGAAAAWAASDILQLNCTPY